MIPQTWWQRSRTLVGWPRNGDFCNAGQEETRAAAEQFILKHGGSVLDVGCNFATLAARLRRAGYSGEYVGVDSNPRAVAAAKRWLDVDVHVADAERLPFADRSFDVVYTKDVIEHQPHYASILAECGRVAKSVLIISMFIRLTDGPDRTRWDHRGYYLNRYSRETLYSFVSGLAFRVPPSVLFAAAGEVSGEDEVLAFVR